MRLQAWNRVRKDCASIVLANMYRRFKSRRELGRLSWKIQARRQKQVSEQHETHALRLQCWWRVYLASRVYMYSVRHHIEIIPDLSKRRLHYPDSSPDSVMATHGVRYKEIIYVGIIAITTLASALGHHQGAVLHFCLSTHSRCCQVPRRRFAHNMSRSRVQIRGRKRRCRTISLARSREKEVPVSKKATPSPALQVRTDTARHTCAHE